MAKKAELKRGTLQRDCLIQLSTLRHLAPAKKSLTNSTE